MWYFVAILKRNVSENVRYLFCYYTQKFNVTFYATTNNSGECEPFCDMVSSVSSQISCISLLLIQ